MASDQGWWARHLGGQQAPPPPPQHFQQPPPPQGYAPAPPQGYQQPPQGYPPAQQPQQGPQAQPQIQVTPSNFMEAANHWQGGEGVRTETQRCPKCGGDHYFSRAQQVTRGPAPAPLCADCGYNGLFDQADQTTWQSASSM